MSRKKKNVIVCDICDDSWITDEPSSVIDIDILGMTLQGPAFYAGPGGGGGLPKGLFICEGCIRGQDGKEPVTLDTLASIACVGLEDWKERERGY